MIGIIAHLERYMSDAEERGNMFLFKQLQKLHQKMVVSHARHTVRLYRICELRSCLSIDVLGGPNQIHRIIQGGVQETPRGCPLHEVLSGMCILPQLYPILMFLRGLDFRWSSGRSIGRGRLV